MCHSFWMDLCEPSPLFHCLCPINRGKYSIESEQQRLSFVLNRSFWACDWLGRDRTKRSELAFGGSWRSRSYFSRLLWFFAARLIVYWSNFRKRSRECGATEWVWHEISIVISSDRCLRTIYQGQRNLDSLAFVTDSYLFVRIIRHRHCSYHVMEPGLSSEARRHLWNARTARWPSLGGYRRIAADDAPRPARMRRLWDMPPKRRTASDRPLANVKGTRRHREIKSRSGVVVNSLG